MDTLARASICSRHVGYVNVPEASETRVSDALRHTGATGTFVGSVTLTSEHALAAVLLLQIGRAHV